MLEEIKKDLKSLWENNYIESAKDLNNKLNEGINEELKSDHFHSNVLPMYFTGKLSSKTVLVMLNPGGGNISYQPYSFFGDKCTYKSADELHQKHLLGCENYGENDADRLDNFDTKQAAFLHDFKDLGFELPNSFWTKDDKTKKEAKKIVLMEKLQLELIPYNSRTFGGLIDNVKNATKNYSHFEPHLLRVLDTIIEHERTTVLFCSNQFHSLLLAANKSDLLKDKITFIEKKGLELQKLTLGFSKVIIDYRGHVIKAGIVHSFASQALPNAYEKMAEYGRFCYVEMKKQD